MSKVRLGQQKVANVVRTFSIIVDEKTDVGTTKQLAICVSFCSKSLDTEVDLLDFVECSDSTAISVFTKLKETFNVFEKPMSRYEIGLVSVLTPQIQ